MYVEDELENESALTPPVEFAAYYLATNNWALPITDSEKAQYTANGYVINKNTRFELIIGCDSMLLLYNQVRLDRNTHKT